jgi:hypothetical protein
VAKENIAVNQVIIIFAVALIVNAIKAVRLYSIMFERKFNLLQFIKLYCKTAVVNMLCPFKAGEIYRGYRYGKMIDSYADGYIIVLLDRFVDTLALITVIVFYNFFVQVNLSTIYIIFMVFLIIVIVCYLLFLPLYQYWNHFMIYNKSSEHTLKILHFFKLCHITYQNINKIVSGRFIVLYAMSLFAWIIEIGSLQTVWTRNNATIISEYLSDIMTGKLNTCNIIFIVNSFIVFILIEIIVGIKILKQKRGNNEKYNSL